MEQVRSSYAGCGLVDCLTQLTFISILWYLYLSVVFHYKYQSYKYERNTAGKPASMWVGVEPISTTLSAMQILHGGMNDFQQSHLNDDIV